MKKKENFSKLPKSNDMAKIIKMVSRNEQFERNGGGQFVSQNKVHKSKKHYNRKRDKKDISKHFDLSFFFI